jgi:hypothetical protein
MTSEALGVQYISETLTLKYSVSCLCIAQYSRYQLDDRHALDTLTFLVGAAVMRSKRTLMAPIK